MFGKYTVAEVGSLVADPSRVAMLTVLLDGRCHSAGELAMAAEVSPQAASAHLGKLTDGRLIRVTQVGRCRLFELARPEVGQMLESIGAVTAALPLRDQRRSISQPLRSARTCYDHLAGSLAVQLTRALIEKNLLRPGGSEYEVLPEGERWFNSHNINVSDLRRGRRRLTRQCLDWTEREPHLGGALGAAWLGRCFSVGWMSRVRGTRALRISDAGRRAFADMLGIAVPELPDIR